MSSSVLYSVLCIFVCIVVPIFIKKVYCAYSFTLRNHYSDVFDA